MRHISGTRARIINLTIVSLDKSFPAFQSRLAEGLGVDIHMNTYLKSKSVECTLHMLKPAHHDLHPFNAEALV